MENSSFQESNVEFSFNPSVNTHYRIVYYAFGSLKPYPISSQQQQHPEDD